MHSDRRLASRAGRVVDIASLVVSCIPAIALAQPAEEARSLAVEPTILFENVAVRATHAADEAVVYLLEAERGGNYLIEVDQEDLDFFVTVESPTRDVHTYSSPVFRDEAEFALLENAIGGPYRITVASEELSSARGSHTISVVSLSGDSEDPRYLEGWRLMSDAAAANAQESAADESRSQFVRDAYEQAAELWRELGETRLQAQALYNAAWITYYASPPDWEGAAERAAAAAQLYEQMGARSLYANAVQLRARALVEIAQLAGEDGLDLFDRALAAFEESHAVHDALGNLSDLAAVEVNMGLAYYNRGDTGRSDFREAAAHYRKAEQLFSRLGEWREALNARQNAALIDLDEGRAASAASELQDILSELPGDADPILRGTVLANLGSAQVYAGNFDAALGAFSTAREIIRSPSPANLREGLALRGLGTIYYSLGDAERAREFFRQALIKTANEGRIRASILARLGNVAYVEADYSEALRLHEMAVAETTSRDLHTYRQTFVVRDLVALGRFEDAIAVARDELDGLEGDTVTKADLDVELGYAYLSDGEVTQAAEAFERAIGIYEALGLRTEQARSAHGLSQVARARGNLDEAISFGEEALRLVESLRTTVSAPGLRAFYSAAQRGYYESQIDLLMTAHDVRPGSASDLLAEALAVSERARARMTMDLLAEAAIGLNRNLPETVIGRQRELYEELGAVRIQLDNMLESTSPTAAQLSELMGRRAEVENALSVLETEIRASNVDRVALAFPEPLTVAQMQAMLDDRTALVQYALGEESSYAWIVTHDAIHGVELADGETIEAAARRAYDGLTTYRAGADPTLETDLRALSSLVVDPIESLLDTAQRLIIAADGALHYVPFGVLPLTEDRADVALLQAFDITNVPSMSVLAVQRALPRRSNPARTVAVFADPVFTRMDPRFSRLEAETIPEKTPLEAFDFDPLAARNLTRLPATAAEARAIADLVPEPSRFVVTAFEASRDTVMSAELSQYRTIHFATHGVVDFRYPGLSALALSRFDAAGQRRNGSLRLQDIYALELNADLVVLSGCETALGRRVRGEGLIGLVQGFLYAGARNLVVSLWPVPDRATAELMSRFYQYLLNEGLGPAQALRRAQLSIAAERRWSDPYFWGPFIVIGGE